MPRIHQLPTNVVTKIAAGEVIERPASVVKELLENSVDAGATAIHVEIEQGGIELIRVVDNGCGIVAEDLPLAFSNHATSKLATAEDLFHVGTLGFRGEALASIGGVAQVGLQSRLHDQPHGAEITCHGGELSEVRPWNGAPGTRMEVRHLFYNTPVRRKFLRTPATEVGHVSEMILRLAIARPGLHLTLHHNGKKIYDVPAALSLPERLRLFFGEDIHDNLFDIDLSQGPAHLFGYVADPVCDRGNAKMQYIFLNGRWIRDRTLSHAIQEGFRGILMTGRYAVAFLYLDLPPQLVDVNVHPTKAEVRFQDASALYRLILHAVKNRLAKENLTTRLQPPTRPLGGVGDFLQPRLAPVTPGLFAQSGLPTYTKTPVPTVFPDPPSIAPALEVTGTDQPIEAITEEPEAAPAAPLLRAIQLHNAYIVVEEEVGMLVIDQHALHERVLFERIKERLSHGPLESQRLLVPEPVELTAQHAALVLEHREALASLGLEVADFGGGTIVVSSYPALFGKRSPAEIVRRVVDHLQALDMAPTREQLFNDLMSLMACHAAVRAGDPLTPEAMAALVEMRHLASDTHHCPHGRPTALMFTRQELDRQFRRV